MNKDYIKQISLPDLPYDYSALEPYISAEIMQLHHTKHHAAYVNNLKIALENINQENTDISALLNNQSAISFNAGGHINHSIFWNNLKPEKNGGGAINKDSLILKEIEKHFQSLESFKEKMSKSAISLQGSGWCWLTYDKSNMSLVIKQTQNQQCPEMFGLVPLLGIDVWEHAYYLQYKNLRADYVKSIWSIINWDDVNNRLENETEK